MCLISNCQRAIYFTYAGFYTLLYNNLVNTLLYNNLVIAGAITNLNYCTVISFDVWLYWEIKFNVLTRSLHIHSTGTV